MPSNISEEVKTRTIHNRQKNGDIYILERKTIYDAEKKYNKVVSTKLVAKIPKGTEIPVPTRPKKAKAEMNTEFVPANDYASGRSPDRISASRTRIGMMNIIGHIGKTSGIDDAIYRNTDTGTAEKIISLARYLLATNGQSLPGILTWQYNHPLPYAEGISEDIYHDLFRSVGADEALQQNFFLSRCGDLSSGVAIAYDSTTVSTYSENQAEARYGYNKAGDGLKTVKYLSLYSIDTRQPIAFTKQPGNLPDVVTISNALSQLMALGVKKAEVVTDNGYYSEKNISEMFQASFGFVTLAKTNLKWIRPEIDSHRQEMGKLSSVCPFDPSTHGLTVILMRDFVKVRKYGSKKAGLSKGDEETFRRKVYLHIFYNATRNVGEDESFNQDLISIKRMLEEGVPPGELSDAAQDKAKKYLAISTRGKTTRIGYNEKACAQAKQYHGFFALVSNSEKDPFSALSKYRKREYIEGCFKSGKQHADSTRLRVWDADTLRGRMFVQFVNLCYYEFLSEKVRSIKPSLGKADEGSVHKSKEQIKLEKKLLSWLENTPIYLQLQWFDVIEGVKISSKLKSVRWATETTSMDNLYLEKLGMATKMF
ncbi:MAG: transposase [Clostridiales bacterium]|nr:transposase [Clostridiales bacterium]